MEENVTTPAPAPRAQQSSLGIPIAIVIAAGLIASAIYFSGSNTPVAGPADQLTGEDETATIESEVEPVTAEDHMRGNPNAPILLVEYSDYDCPFCKNFHETMNQIMTEYGTKGQVAWVYRHFPLEQLHPNAPKIAEAAECVAELGGNEAFWTFSDLVFGERGTNEPTSMAKLPEFAAEAGVGKGQFEQCLNSGKYTTAIADDVQAAIAAGGRGTPHTIVFVGDQQVGVINGAQPYSAVKQNVDSLLAQIAEKAGN